MCKTYVSVSGRVSVRNCFLFSVTHDLRCYEAHLNREMTPLKGS